MPMNRENYPENWEEFSQEIRFTRAKGQCECQGECVKNKHRGRCPRRHGECYVKGAGRGAGNVVLTVAHLNRVGGPCECEPKCAKKRHVKAMCQGCHLMYDLPRHMLHASLNRDKKSGQLRLF